MNTLFSLLSWLADDADKYLAMLTIWATAVLGVAYVVTRIVKSASSAIRYSVWQSAIVGLLFVPILCLLLPGIPFGIEIQPTSRDTSVEERRALAQAANSNLSVIQSQQTIVLSQVQSEPQSPLVLQTAVAKYTSASPHQTPQVKLGGPETALASTRQRMSWPLALLGIWCVGLVAQLAWLAICSMRIRKRVSGAIPITNSTIETVLENLGYCSTHRNHIITLEAEWTQIPLVVGIFRPRILLPSHAQTWPAKRLRMVLSHELAHVERRDVLWQLVARGVAAVYWFHPLVWLAILNMRVEREHACDDHVLRRGFAPVDYATELVDVAAALNHRQTQLVGGIGIAHAESRERDFPSSPEKRRRGRNEIG